MKTFGGLPLVRSSGNLRPRVSLKGTPILVGVRSMLRSLSPPLTASSVSVKRPIIPFHLLAFLLSLLRSRKQITLNVGGLIGAQRSGSI